MLSFLPPTLFNTAFKPCTSLTFLLKILRWHKPSPDLHIPTHQSHILIVFIFLFLRSRESVVGVVLTTGRTAEGSEFESR
jgi:hypothetical protein